ncbi:hypothetical protein JNW90_33905 [Micromonospora sp. STR1s_5]|nr:hypothetical protein [Micromonospora sp. STR1s_5]
MKFGEYPKIPSLGTVTGLRNHLGTLGLDMPCDDIVASGPDSPLGSGFSFNGMEIGNRLGINPMEGWDGEADGRPSENTFRRWQRFGESGGKLIWGGEAVAVRHDGRANPRQLYLADHTQAKIARLREVLVDAHRGAVGSDKGLVIGLQLTHSGRFCKPNDNTKFESQIAYRHPLLDRKFHYPDDKPVMTDDEIRRLVEDYVRAARQAQACGYDFVDVKHCHGYLAHEFLTREDPARPLRGVAREPHALPARDRGGHSGGSAGPEDRRAPQHRGPRAVQARPGPVRAGRARARNPGGHRGAAPVPLRLRGERDPPGRI